MKHSLVIVLFDHPWEHTSDYATQTCIYLKLENFVIGILLKDALSIKEIIVSLHSHWIWKKQENNFYLFKPIYIIPFRRFKLVENLNIIVNTMFLRVITKIICVRKKIKKKYLWIFNPNQYKIFKLLRNGVYSIYDCVDFHGKENNNLNEYLLVRETNTVVTNSSILYKTLRKIRNDIYLAPLGFDLAEFSRTDLPNAISLPKNRPIIGYVGGINSRLDYALLIELVKKSPLINFVFVGPIQIHNTITDFNKHTKPKIDILRSQKNAYFYQHVSKEIIPKIICQFTVGMIPYDISQEFNLNCYPMKLFEYFYEKKPVIATPILELKRFPEYVKLGKTSRQWELLIKTLVSKNWSSNISRRQFDIAKNNSWDTKFRYVLSLLPKE